MNERIRQLRKELNMTQQEFANRIGVKRNTVATYEGGRNAPVSAVISLICREFNVNEDWLKNGTGEMFIEKSTFSLDECADANNLSENERAIVRGFMELEPEARSVVCKAVYGIFNQVFDSSHIAAKISNHDNDADID